METEKKEPKSEAELVKDGIMSKLNKRFAYAIDYGRNTPAKAYNTVTEYFDKCYDDMPAEVRNIIENHLNKWWLTTAYVTVLVTNRKKGKVIKVADQWNHGHLMGKILNLPENARKLAHHKQVLEGRVMFKEPNEIFCIDNARPKKFCCSGMRSQFRICEQDGLSCPDYFIKHTLSGQYVIEADNATYSATHCPFCGAKLYERDNAANHRILLLERDK